MANYTTPAATDMELKLNQNLTTSQGVQPLYQAVLDRQLLVRSKPKLVMHQFGQKVKIKKGKGKTITFQQLSPLPKSKAPLIEGITPKGSALNVHELTAVAEQYGNYIATSDQFEFFTPDPPPVLLKLNELLAANAAETIDSLTADVLTSGTNVQYPNGRAARASLTSADVMSVEEIRKAVRTLKGNKAQAFKDGYFVAIVHPDISFDLMSDKAWQDVKTYSDPKDMYAGEIGRLYGVRFVETTEAPVFYGEALGGYDSLQVVKTDTASKTIYIYEDLTASQAAALAGRKVLIDGRIYNISSASAGENGQAAIVVSENVPASVKPDMTIYAGEGTADGKPVYATLIIGQNAYGVTDPDANLENITKSLGSGGTADPLNQRSTVGWKALHTAKILVDEYMVRIETVSTRYADIKSVSSDTTQTGK